jgi:transcription elongation factor Elf1
MSTQDFKAEDHVACPKCGNKMVLAAITSNPINTQMERQTFLCADCNKTKTYVVPSKAATVAGRTQWTSAAQAWLQRAQELEKTGFLPVTVPPSEHATHQAQQQPQSKLEPEE